MCAWCHFWLALLLLFCKKIYKRDSLRWPEFAIIAKFLMIDLCFGFLEHVFSKECPIKMIAQPMSNKWIKLSISVIKQFYPKNYRNFVWTFPNIVLDPKWLPSTEFKFLTKKLHNFHQVQSFWWRTKCVGLLKNKFEPRKVLGIIDFYLIWTGLMGR